MKNYSLSLAVLFFFALARFAGAQVSPGTPSFGAYDTDPSGYTTINLQNLNVMLNVPVMSKAGAFPFQFVVSGNFYMVPGLAWAPSILDTPLVGFAGEEGIPTRC